MQNYEMARAVADAWRATQPPPRIDGGHVRVWDGEVYGWAADALAEAGTERPGALAVAVDGAVYEAVGGNYSIGAAEWVEVAPAHRLASGPGL